jgi:hypothetical protein
MFCFAALLPIRSNPQALFGLILAVLLTAFSVLRRSDGFAHAKEDDLPS